MKHASTRELHAYWTARRGTRPAPERNDIEPGAIRRVLADTFMLNFDLLGGHPFRIAGTRVCAAFGRELKGAAFIDIWAADSREPVRDILSIVARESIGAVAGVSGKSRAGAALGLELLALPLAHRSGAGTRILGALVPTELPYWLGVETLGPLTLGTIRYLGPQTEPLVPPARAGHGRTGDARARHGLLVYDGGQA